MSYSQKTVIYAEPEQCGMQRKEPNERIGIIIGEGGYHPVQSHYSAAELNSEDVTTEIIESAIAGSMFGWHTPAAAIAIAFDSGEDMPIEIGDRETTEHAYEVETENGLITVHANKRTTAASLAKRAGYTVKSINMIA